MVPLFPPRGKIEPVLSIVEGMGAFALPKSTDWGEGDSPAALPGRGGPTCPPAVLAQPSGLRKGALVPRTDSRRRSAMRFAATCVGTPSARDVSMTLAVVS